MGGVLRSGIFLLLLVLRKQHKSEQTVTTLFNVKIVTAKGTQGLMFSLRKYSFDKHSL